MCWSQLFVTDTDKKSMLFVQAAINHGEVKSGEVKREKIKSR